MNRFATNLLFAFLLLTFTLKSQPPSPAPAQKGSVLILGATAHIGNGLVIPSSAIAFENGRLTMVADMTVIRIDRSKYSKVIEAGGRHAWPGFIALNTRLGLVEVDAARATNDAAETGSLNPNVRAIIAYNTDSEIPPTLRSNGVLMAQICPEGGQMSGQSSVVQLDAWNWEDASVRLDEGQHLNWPFRQIREREEGDRRPGQEPKKDEYAAQIQALDLLFGEAKAWLARPSAEQKNQKFESMRGLFDGSKRLYIHTESAKSIEESIVFSEKWSCRAVIVGGGESWLITDFLKKHGVPVILNQTHSMPPKEDSDIDQPFKTPALLAKAGVEFAISHNGSWRARNLPFQAGHAVGFGLEKEAALTSISLTPAKILGIEKQVGSLEIGKDATLFLSAGDALDMRGCKVETAFIQGREISLDNKQKRLHDRFGKKFKG